MINLEYKELSPAKAKENLDSNVDIFLVDVREIEEYNMGHIEGAEIIPLGEVEDAFKDMDIDKEQTIYVYCRSGQRSAVAQQVITSLGFKDVYNIGGVLQWPFELVH
ncbi:MAG: rhodanese-like domain-containing protein [Sarcina sp.]